VAIGVDLRQSFRANNECNNVQKPTEACLSTVQAKIPARPLNFTCRNQSPVTAAEEFIGFPNWERVKPLSARVVDRR